MPAIKDFRAFRIHMYYEDHNPPHVHIAGPAFAAKMRIDDQTVFAGEVPAKAERCAAKYVAANKADLMRRWIKYSG